MYKLFYLYYTMPLLLFKGGPITLHWINEETGEEILTYGEIEVKPL